VTGAPDKTAAASEPGLVSHLLELRSRLLRAVLALAVAFAALLPFANQLYAWLAAPLLARLPEGAQLIAIEVASPFLAPLKLALFLALLLAMPVALYQLWSFVAPGLYRREKRLALPLLVSAVALFYAGCAFAYYLVLPAMFAFLTASAPEGVAMMTDISRYLDFVLVIFLAFGLSFELPVAVAGPEDPSRRAELWRHREAITEAVNQLGPPVKLDVTLPATELAAFVDDVPAALPPTARTWLFGHVADGNVHVNVTGVDPADEAVDDAVLRLVAERGGSISAEHGIGTAKQPWLHLVRSAAELSAMRAIKAALDPDGILNPHALLPA